MFPLLGGLVGIGPKRRAIIGAEVVGPAELLEVLERVPHHIPSCVLNRTCPTRHLLWKVKMESGCRISGMPLIKSAIVLIMSSLLVPFAQAPTVRVRPSTVD
eukprot:5120142-Heterocapsa_arctica.AAC.1